jgi:ribosomal protein L32
VTGPVRCPSCADALEKKFQEVKAYIWDHKLATIQEISDENDVSVGQLRQWVREERLTFAEDSPVGLECENCGATIKTGRFCPACKSKLGNSLSNAISKPEPERPKPPVGDHKNKMRYLQ